MGWQRLTCACALALVACGDNQGTATQSGSRLKLYWYSYVDGPRQLADGDLWDDQRQEACRPRKWSDGNTYCTPEAQFLVPHYTTSDCTSAKYLIEGVERPSYVMRFTPAGDDTLVDKLSHPVADLIDSYWVLDGDECTGPIDGRARSYWGEGEEVERSDLVRLRVRESTGEGRVAVRATTTDDGLYLPLDLEDRELHSPCLLSPESDAAAWCLPEATGDVQFRDDGCTRPVLAHNGSADPVPPAIVLGSTCSPRAYAVVGETAEAPAYASSNGMCIESDQTGNPWFELREHPVATVARRRVTTGERIEAIVMDVDGITVPARQLFDNDIGAECVRAAQPNSVFYRCVPRWVGFVVDGFNDVNCTVPIEVAFVYSVADRGVCNSDRAPRYARDFNGRTIIREVAGPRSALVYTSDGEGCRVDASPRYSFYELGPAVPDEQWARSYAAAHD